MKRPYETMIVYDGTLSEDTVHKEQEKMTQFLEKNGVMEKLDVWGRRDLAYDIRRKRVGYYCLFSFSGDNALPSKIDKHLKLNEAILRYATVVRRTADAATGAAEARPVVLDTVDDGRDEER